MFHIDLRDTSTRWWATHKDDMVSLDNMKITMKIQLEFPFEAKNLLSEDTFIFVTPTYDSQAYPLSYFKMHPTLENQGYSD